GGPPDLAGPPSGVRPKASAGAGRRAREGHSGVPPLDHRYSLGDRAGGCGEEGTERARRDRDGRDGRSSRGRADEPAAGLSGSRGLRKTTDEERARRHTAPGSFSSSIRASISADLSRLALRAEHLVAEVDDLGPLLQSVEEAGPACLLQPGGDAGPEGLLLLLERLPVGRNLLDGLNDEERAVDLDEAAGLALLETERGPDRGVRLAEARHEVGTGERTRLADLQASRLGDLVEGGRSELLDDLPADLAGPLEHLVRLDAGSDRQRHLIEGVGPGRVLLDQLEHVEDVLRLEHRADIPGLGLVEGPVRAVVDGADPRDEGDVRIEGRRARREPEAAGHLLERHGFAERLDGIRPGQEREPALPRAEERRGG